MAVRLKEAVAESEVTVVSIGDDSVKNSLKNCLAVGADHAYLENMTRLKNWMVRQLRKFSQKQKQTLK